MPVVLEGLCCGLSSHPGRTREVQVPEGEDALSAPGGNLLMSLARWAKGEPGGDDPLWFWLPSPTRNDS